MTPQFYINPRYLSLLCDARDIPYKFKRKINWIYGYLFELEAISKIRYKLYLDTDYFILLDTLNNKILCYENYSISIVALTCRITELLRMYSYENGSIKIDNQVKSNDYRSLWLKYYGKRKN